jgi:metal-responsive CopG/Arc/MetJ family transcriptional regulator
MRVESALHRQVSPIQNEVRADASSMADEIPQTRRVSVHLSKRIYEQLEAVTQRPGVGKSMVIEAALDRFLRQTPPAEDFIREQFDQIRARLERFDRDMQIIAEMVALHARYHLTVMPVMPESEQREACLRGDERFMVLAEQVDRRIRSGRSLVQEAIDRFNAANSDGSACNSGGEPPRGPQTQRARQEAASESVANAPNRVCAAAREGGSNSFFRRLPNSFSPS